MMDSQTPPTAETVDSSPDSPYAELESCANKAIDIDSRYDIGWFVQYTMRPRTIAVVGATERPGTVGRTTLENLMEHYGSMESKRFKLFPVNPTRTTLWGMTCYAKVSDIPEPVDMVLVVVPAKFCVDVMHDCGKNGSKVVVIIASGFKEVGPEGLALENECVRLCKEYGMRLVGPNCLGIMNPHHKMNATFAASPAAKGGIGFISQSGAMCTAVLDWSRQVNIGFSAFVSIGSMAGVDWADLIHYMGQDDKTEAIMIYMETIGDAEGFLKAAREVTMRKPVFCIKAGRTESAAAAAVSHTGSLAGSHDAFLAALRRCGVLVVDTIGELFECALLVDKMPRPQRKGVVIITNAGGPGVVTTDAAEMNDFTVSELPEKLITDLNKFLPAAWSHGNPIDVLGDASADLYSETLQNVLDNCADTTGAICIVLSPQSVTDPTLTAKKVSDVYTCWRKNNPAVALPLVCAWMGGKAVEEGFQILNKSGIPTFSLPDAAVRAVALMYKQVTNVRAVAGAPLFTPCPFQPDSQKAMAAINKAKEDKRSILSETESKEILKAYGIPVAESIICESPEDTGKAATQVGFPVVIKLNSEKITHKSDVGGVKLNIKTVEDAEKAFSDIKTTVDAIDSTAFQGVSVQPMLDIASGVELVVGSFSDNQFGPMVMFGTGGCFVEVFKDTVLGCPPLTKSESSMMIDRTKISMALKGGHGMRFQGCPMDDLIDVMVRFSYMVFDLWDVIAECEMNPVLALKDRIIALDARVVLHDESAEMKPCKPALKPIRM